MARIAGINIPQNKLVHVGLTYIYGIGDKFSKQICDALNFPKEKTAIILGNEALLIPTLSAIDDKLLDWNVTMGYPIAETSTATFFQAF